jgi:hypothetical protein
MDTRDGGWVENEVKGGVEVLRVNAETVPLARGRSRIGGKAVAVAVVCLWRISWGKRNIFYYLDKTLRLRYASL